MTQSSIKNNNFQIELRYAHVDGHTELAFIPEQNRLITCGIDCEIRTWLLKNQDGDPLHDGIQASFPSEDLPYSIVCTTKKIFIALGSNCCKSYSLVDGEFGDEEKLITRFTSNATCLELSSDQELLAIGSADFSIKLIDLIDEEQTAPPKLLEGHEGPILSLALDPLKKYLASSSCDGSVFLWSLDSKSIQHKWLNVFKKSNDFENSQTLCRLCWQPTMGEYLLIPKDDSIEIYKRGQWNNVHLFIRYPQLFSQQLDPFSVVCFSSDGQRLAASSKTTLAIWNWNPLISNGEFEPIASLYDNDKPITCLKFNPNNSNQVVCTDKSGSLRFLKIINQNKNQPRQNQSSNKISNQNNNQIISQKTINNILNANDNTNDDDDFEMDDDDDVFNDLDLEQEINNKKTSTTTTTAQESKINNNNNDESMNQFGDIDDDDDQLLLGNDDDDIDLTTALATTTTAKTSKKTVEEEAEVVDEDFDISAIKSKYEPLIFGSEQDDFENKSKSNATGGGSFLQTNKLSSTSELIIDNYRITGQDLLDLCRQPRRPQPIRQQAFQSSSTPIHYRNRFMVWNSVGIVYSYKNDNSDGGIENSIDVEFHDQTFHHSMHLTNMFNYIFGDLSTSCLLLASNGDDNSDDYLDHQKARLFCLQFNSWDSIKEWQMELPQQELFECISAGQTFVAALTSQRYLRVWTVGGIQTMIRSIDGPAINLSSYEKFLMVLYHSAAQHPEDGQSVSCFSLKVDHQGRTRAHPIPNPIPVALSPKSTIYWAGFTDEGTPCVVDSDGIVRVYKTHFGQGWFPLASTKKHANGKSDNFFIIGLSEIQQQIRCIFCKASRYPDTIPKPTLTILPLQIPLCELPSTNINGDDLLLETNNNSSNLKSKYEEESLRYRWLKSLLKKLSLDGFDIDEQLKQTDKFIINSSIKLFALALNAERETLALEIGKLLPNKLALEGAVHYAEQKKHRSLAMKLLEMIQEADDNPDGFIIKNDFNDEQDEQQNSDLELEELMNKKEIDKLRQLIKDDDSITNKNNKSMVSLNKLSELEKEEFTTLKPKSMKKSNGMETSLTTSIEPNLDDDDDDIDDDQDEEIIQLRPKKLSNIQSNVKNPFKRKSSSSSTTANNDNRKRKQIVSDDEDEDDSILISDGEDGKENHNDDDKDGEDEDNSNQNVEENGNDDEPQPKSDEEPEEEEEKELDLDNDPGFSFYFEENRVKIFEELTTTNNSDDNDDEIETEEDLIKLAKEKYLKLTKKQQEKWLKKGKKQQEKKNKEELKKNNKKTPAKRLKSNNTISSENDSKTNKITNFFTKKT